MKYKNITVPLAAAFFLSVTFSSINVWAEDMGHAGRDMSVKEDKKDEHAGHIHEKDADGNVIYACSMHPEVTSIEPGQSCPKCGMFMQPVEVAKKNDDKKDKKKMGMKEGIHEGHKKPAMSLMPDMPTMNDTKKEKSNQQRIAVYACPMHPEITSHKPGQRCSRCGMHMVAIDSSSSVDFKSQVLDRTAVKMDYYKEQKIGVATVKAEKRQLFKSIRSPGRAAFDPELYTAQSEYIEALKQWDRVRKSPLKEVKRSTREMIKSAEIRLKILGLPDEEIANLKKKKNLSESLLLSKGGEGWIYADIFEMDIPFILKGQSAEVSAKFLMGEVLAAEVISVDEVVNLETRTAKVRLKLKKGGPKIRPQSYVNVEILVPSGEHVAVPHDAVLDTGRETFVFVKSGDGVFEPRPVVVMFEAEGMVAIASGLSEGEEVVSQGSFMLDSEARLQSVFSKGASMGEHAGH